MVTELVAPPTLAPGALMFAVLGAEHPERHTGLSALGRELAHTLHRVVDLLERGARAVKDPALLMRGGKAAYLVGELDSSSPRAPDGTPVPRPTTTGWRSPRAGWR